MEILSSIALIGVLNGFGMAGVPVDIKNNPSMTGVRVQIPICNPNYYGTSFVCGDPKSFQKGNANTVIDCRALSSLPLYYVRQNDGKFDSTDQDFHGRTIQYAPGIMLYHATDGECPVNENPPSGSMLGYGARKGLRVYSLKDEPGEFTTVAEIEGAVDERQNVAVEGSVRYSFKTIAEPYTYNPKTGDLQLAVQIKEGIEWRDVSTTTPRLTKQWPMEEDWGIYEEHIQAVVPADAEVRFQVRLRDPGEGRYWWLWLHRVEFFVPRCFGDIEDQNICAN